MDIYFSVIIPVYNVKAYLEQCVDSVIGQERSGFEYEVILVDDGSNDGSSELCDKYMNIDNVTVVHKQNGGLGSARNVGLDYAKGKYIWFLDSDDFIENDALQKLYLLIQQHQYDIIYFGAVCLSEDLELEGLDLYRRSILLNKCVDGKQYLKEAMEAHEYHTSVCLRLFRKELVEKRRFSESILHEDEDFGFFTALSAQNVIVISDRLYYRRYRSGSIMSNNNLSKRIEGYYYAWKQIYDYCNRSEIDNEERELCIIKSRDLVFCILILYCNSDYKERRKVKKELRLFLNNVSAFSKAYGKSFAVAKLNIELYRVCKLVIRRCRNLKNQSKCM